jgi:hypothetical protein
MPAYGRRATICGNVLGTKTWLHPCFWFEFWLAGLHPPAVSTLEANATAPTRQKMKKNVAAYDPAEVYSANGMLLGTTNQT